MEIFNYKTVKTEKVDCCPEKTQIRRLIKKEMGAPNFVVRLLRWSQTVIAPCISMLGNMKYLL